MTVYMCPGLESLSEFIAGYTGDCGPDAALMALHVYDPTRWPLDAAALGAIVRDEQSRGDAAANGAQNIPSMDAYLTSQGVTHTTVGYGDFSLDQLHATLKGLENHPRPVIVETSAGGAMPDDERGVVYHYYVIGGIKIPTPEDPNGGYYRVDGDSNTDSASGAATAPILTSWSEIQATAPIAFIIVEGTPQEAASMSYTKETDANGHITYRDDATGQRIGPGVYDHISAEGEQRPCIVGEQAYGAGQNRVAVFGDKNGDRTTIWDGTRLCCVDDWGGHVIADLLAELATVRAQLQALQAAPQPPTFDTSGFLAQLQAAQRTTATLNDELTRAVASLPTTQS